MANASQAGHYVVGELLSDYAGREYQSQGKTHQPWELKILVADEIVKVQYQDEAAARSVLGETKKGGQVSVRVRVQLMVVKDRSPWLSYRGVAKAAA